MNSLKANHSGRRRGAKRPGKPRTRQMSAIAPEGNRHDFFCMFFDSNGTVWTFANGEWQADKATGDL